MYDSSLIWGSYDGKAFRDDTDNLPNYCMTFVNLYLLVSRSYI